MVAYDAARGAALRGGRSVREGIRCGTGSLGRRAAVGARGRITMKEQRAVSRAARHELTRKKPWKTRRSGFCRTTSPVGATTAASEVYSAYTLIKPPSCLNRGHLTASTEAAQRARVEVIVNDEVDTLAAAKPTEKRTVATTKIEWNFDTDKQSA